MQKNKNITSGWHRPQLDEFPPVGLPFYPRSVGHFIRSYPCEENIPQNTKPFVQFFWMISGEMQFVFDSKPYLIKAGDVCYRLPDEEHIQKVLSVQAEYRWLTFDGDNAADFINAYGFPRTGWHAGKCPEELFIEYEDRMREMTPYCWRKLCSIVTEVLCKAGGNGEETTDLLPLFRRAVSLCRQHYTESSFNVNMLAAMLKVNRTTVNRYFIRNMGISAGKYIEQLKIQHAVSVLQSSNLTLAETAEQSGLHDSSYLCRIIKKHYGTTPGKLRTAN